MTHIHFEYSDAYGSGSRGSLAFTPHRRHAANETEVLPKPFTVPLLNGEVTVDLKPNPSTWVWIITEYFDQHSESFYTTIPDRDGVLEAVDLVRINPSTIPAPYNAVEPVWWAEMRQYKQTVTDTLLQSGEALTEAKAAIETGRESIERTRENASLSKAYSETSREYSYESKEYRDEAKTWRDEAQEQADRAASGPESAAARALVSEQNAKVSEDAARGYENASRTNAAEASADSITAQTSASQAVAARTEATSQADRAQSEASRAQGYADDLLSGPQDYVTEAKAARDAAQGHEAAAESFAQSSQTYSVTSGNHKNDTEYLKDQTETVFNNVTAIQSDMQESLDELNARSSAVLRGTGSVYGDEGGSVLGVSEYAQVDVKGENLTVENGVVTVHKTGIYNVSLMLRVSKTTRDITTQAYVAIQGSVTGLASTLSTVGSTDIHSIGTSLLLTEGDTVKVEYLIPENTSRVSEFGRHTNTFSVVQAI